jgi:hypothetical protein
LRLSAKKVFVEIGVFKVLCADMPDRAGELFLPSDLLSEGDLIVD